MGKLTDRRLDDWMRKGAPIVGKSDGEGLTFTLSKAGTAAWVFRYRAAGRQREVTLGNYPDISLKAARVAARAARVMVDQGVDVAGEKRKAKLEASRAGSFKQLADDYLERAGPSLAASTAKEIRRYLTKDIVPRVGHLSAADVTGSDVVLMVERIANRSDPVARRAFEIVSVIYSHGVAKHLVKMNPCVGLKLSAILGTKPERRRRVMLGQAELQRLLIALPPIGPANALAAKILLATCVRKGELTRARWEHVDLQAAVWTIPDEHSKTGKGFVIPLATGVVGWFEELRCLAGGSEWVLPGQRGTHMSRTTLNVALSRVDADLPHFSPHDLRSTARSHLARLGVSVIVAERCLNHALGGLIGVYDQHDYMDERRRALELWAKVLALAEQGERSNVTALRIAA